MVPWLRGSSTWAHRIVRNWELSGVFQAQSGTPFSVRNNVDYAGVGAGSENQFWNLVGDPSTTVTGLTDSAAWYQTGLSRLRTKVNTASSRGTLYRIRASGM
jgi:hypothetical protein